VDLPCEVLASSAGPHDMHCVANGRRPVETLSKAFSTMLLEEA
jgi:hypothetical protein